MTRPMSADVAVGCALILAASLLPSPVQAQERATVNFTERSNWLLGYVAAPPRQMLGFGAAAILRDVGSWGLMVDGRITTDSPARDDGISDRTPAQADNEGDIFNLDKNAWSSVNLAVVKGVTPEFAAYVGGGVSWRTAYLRYFDETRERGELGFYWVEDEAESQVFPNVQGGVFFRLGDHLVFQIGGQSAPVGVITGIHLRVR